MPHSCARWTPRATEVAARVRTLTRSASEGDVNSAAPSLALRVSVESPTRNHRVSPLTCLLTLFICLLFVSHAHADVEEPVGDHRAAIEISAGQAHRWQQGAYDVWHLRGNCEIRQGDVHARGREAVLWIEPGDSFSGRPFHVIAYLEGDVIVDYPHGGAPHRVTGRAAQSIADQTWLGRFHSTAGIQMRVPTVGGEPTVKPDIFQRGLDAQNPNRHLPVRPVQFSPEPVPTPTTGTAPSSSTGPRRILVTPRSTVRVQARTFNNPDRNEQIAVIDSGVRVVVEGLEVRRIGEIGNLMFETDRLVVWTSGLQGQDLSGQTMQRDDAPLEFYMEGNIVFRQGDRVIYAERMYYNVNQRVGVILNAEMLTPVPDYQGLVRLKADVLQQLNEQTFQAFGAAVTSSRLGVPSYWFQSENVTFQDRQNQRSDPQTGQAAIDPQSGQPNVDHQLLATSRNNFLYVGGVPIFYWPVMATDLTKPTYYINNLKVRSDTVFGFQTLVDLDAYQLLGLREPPVGTKWNVSTDYLSERGPALGTNFRYNRENLFGIPGPYRGLIDAWGVNDSGRDNLGADRRSLLPEEDFRGRILAQHRHYLPNGFQLTGEFGLISDRNFLEQYYEWEWDQNKDQTTGLELKRLSGNTAWSVVGDTRLNDFFTQTEWLPRGDHFWLGQPLFDRLTWYEHSHVGYARMRAATPPRDPAEAAKTTALAWEADREGLRAGTRQELDLPFDLGPVRLVPYALGDITHWQEDLTGDEVTRAYGQLGVRASMPMWRANPAVQSTLFNLNGLAHKVVFETEVFWADANRDLSRFPLYDPLDDDSQEAFRRRFLFETFPGATAIPRRFDERFYALRTGMQSAVTAPSLEIADDLTLARFGVRQRWQTKRGLPGQERIIDWIVLDVEGVFFPDPSRDNFGESIGLLDYDFRWHVGDRVTLLSDGFADVFSDGLRTFSVGGLMGRPEVGNVYLGYRAIEGPITSNVISGSLNYRMSEKWIASAGAAVDLGPAGNIGQSLSFTRIGESALVRLGFNIDVSRGNFGAVFSIEPRFLPSSRLGRVGGVQIPPAGALGLE
jgi:hypothetical protein